MNNEIHSAPGDKQDNNTLNDVNDWLNIGQEYDNLPPASPDGRGVGSDDYMPSVDQLAGSQGDTVKEYDPYDDELLAPPLSPTETGSSHGDYLAQQKERIQEQILDLQERAPLMGVTVAEAEIQTLIDEYDRLVAENPSEEE